MTKENILVVAETRAGKTNLVLQLLQQVLGVIVFLGKETNAGAELLVKSMLEANRPIIFDDLDDQEHVFPIAALPRTNDEFEKHRIIEGFLENLLRRRGARNADQNPMIETVTSHFANLVYELDLELPTDQLFRQGRVQGNSESANFWNEIPGGYSRERIVGPTERLTAILNNPAIRRRLTRDGNRFIQMIDQGFSYALQGGHSITQAALRYVIGTRIQEVIQYKRSGGRQPVTLVIEEAEALGLTMQEAVALQTLVKTGLRFILISQEAKFDE